MIRCIYCGCEIDDEDIFCKYCGAKLQSYDPLEDEVLDESQDVMIEEDEDVEELGKQLPWNNKVALRCQDFGIRSYFAMLGSFVFCKIAPLFGIGFGILGLVLCIICFSKARKAKRLYDTGEYGGKQNIINGVCLAITDIVLIIFAIVLSVVKIAK